MLVMQIGVGIGVVGNGNRESRIGVSFSRIRVGSEWELLLIRVQTTYGVSENSTGSSSIAQELKSAHCIILQRTNKCSLLNKCSNKSLIANKCILL